MALDELKARIKDAPISAIVAHYVPLVKKGTSLVAKCPFHNDKNPSMHVSDSKGLFRCFACNTGGDAITFVEKFRRVEFIEALQDISKILGLNFDDYQNKRERSPKEAMGHKVLNKTMQLYRKIATSNGAEAFSNFLDKRKLKSETATEFSVGIVVGNSPLTHYLQTIKDQKERDLATSVAIELNLLKRDEKDQHLYDAFRDRVMFPIWDQMGQVVGFGGRALDNNHHAKYLNSRESFLFNKKNILYGFHLAKAHIRERNAVFIVEGYMDQIAMYQAGFKNTIAIMGVGLSPHMITMLKNLTQNIYLALDNDDAGMLAMQRLSPLFLEQDLIPFHLSFAPHKDPDEFLTHESALLLTERIEKSPRFIDIELHNLIPKEIPELYDQKLRILHQAFKLLSPLRTNLEATERVIDLSKKLGLKSGPDQIIKNYEAHLKTFDEKKVYHPPKEEKLIEAPTERELVPETPKTAPLQKVESQLLSEITMHPELLLHGDIATLLDLVGNNDVKQFVSRLRNIIYEIDDSEYTSVVTNLIALERLPLEIREVVGASLFRYQETKLNETVVSRLVTDFRRKLEEERLKRRKDELKSLHQNAQSADETNFIMSELLRVEQELQVMKSPRKNSQGSH